MKAVLGLLDLTDGLSESAVESWWEQVADSLSRHTPEWLEATELVTEFNSDRAWTFLSWVELAANVIGRRRSHLYLEIAAFAISLLEESAIDRRDRAVVAALLRRAADVTGLDFVTSVTLGCRRAGGRGAACIDWLIRVEGETPDTHDEALVGEVVTFARKPSGFDVSDLEAWLDGGNWHFNA